MVDCYEHNIQMEHQYSLIIFICIIVLWRKHIGMYVCTEDIGLSDYSERPGKLNYNRVWISDVTITVTYHRRSTAQLLRFNASDFWKISWPSAVL
jgi:hypothetical protein